MNVLLALSAAYALREFVLAYALSELLVAYALSELLVAYALREFVLAYALSELLVAYALSELLVVYALNVVSTIYVEIELTELRTVVSPCTTTIVLLPERGCAIGSCEIFGIIIFMELLYN